MPLLSRKSLHAKFYNLMYDDAHPRNLCPYFWRLVIGTILFIPAFIWHLPTVIIRGLFVFFDKNDKDNWVWKEDGWLCKEDLGLSLGVNVMIGIVICMVACWFPHALTEVIIIGGVGYIITAILVIALCYRAYQEAKIKREKQKIAESTYIQKKSTSSLIYEVVKAKYEKNCPQIKWKD